MNRIGTLSLAFYLTLVPAALAVPMTMIDDTCRIDSIQFDPAASAIVITGRGQNPSWTPGKGAAADRFFLDLPGKGGSPTYLSDHRAQVLSPRHPLVKQIRFAPNREGVVRLVIDGAGLNFPAARLKPQGGGWRLSIPVLEVKPAVQASVQPEEPAAWPPETEAPPQTPPPPKPSPVAKTAATAKPTPVIRFPVTKAPPAAITLPPPPGGEIMMTEVTPPPEAAEPAPIPAARPQAALPEPAFLQPPAAEPAPLPVHTPPVTPTQFDYGTPNIQTPVTTPFGQIYWRLSHNLIATEFPGHAEPTWSVGFGLFKHLSMDLTAMIQHKFKDQELGIRYQLLDEAEGAPFALASRISYLTHQQGMMVGDVTVSRNNLLPGLGLGLIGRYFSYVSDFEDKGPMTAGGTGLSYSLLPGLNLVGDLVIPFNSKVLTSHGFNWSSGIQWTIPDTPHILTLKLGRMGAQSSFGRTFPHAMDEYVIGFEYNVGLDVPGLSSSSRPSKEEEE